MRQIEAISAMLAYMLTGKEPQLVTVAQKEQTLSKTNTLYQKLQSLVAQGNICDAENLLFAAMDESDPEVPEAALQFYGDINKLSDAELEEHNFSREEILSGLKEVSQNYGIDFF